MIDFLIKKINKPDINSIFAKAVSRKNMDYLKVLMKYNIDFNYKFSSEDTFLMIASQHQQNVDVIEMLINKGIDINTKSKRDGKTALIIATEDNSNIQIIETLLKHGADVNIKDNKGKTALITVIENNRHIENSLTLRVVEALLKHNADINIKDNEGKTAFDYLKENYEFYKFLGDNGYNTKICKKIYDLLKQTKEEN